MSDGAPKLSSLRIERISRGGFVVSEAYHSDAPLRYCGPLFACTDIGEALNFVRDELAPRATGHKR